MPIIINGGSRRAGSWWAKHLTNKEKNERVELIEIRGLAAESVSGVFKEMEALAIGTKCDNYFYQANINPRADEHLTPEQWVEAVDTLERNLGLTGQPRFVIEHEKDGRTHRHVVWSRIDVEHQRAISDSLTAAIHERTSRELEIAFGLERGKSVLVPDRDFDRPERGPEKWETFRGARNGIDPRAITAELTELWQNSDSGQSFKAAIEERGYILAQGDRRDFVVLDGSGDVHSLARRLEGVRAKDVRERLADLDGSALPNVTEARALIEARSLSIERPVRNSIEVEPPSVASNVAIAADKTEVPSEPQGQGPTPGRSIVSVSSPDTSGREADGPSDIALGGNALRGIGRVLDGIAKIAESVLDIFDGLMGGSPAPQHRAELHPAPPPAPEFSPVAEVPRATAQIDSVARYEAVLRAVTEMESSLRQELQSRDPEAGRGEEIMRERLRH
jgi:hypothetical protein